VLVLVQHELGGGEPACSFCTRPPKWSGLRWVISTVSTWPGATPAAARLAGSMPTVGFVGPHPVSTSATRPADRIRKVFTAVRRGTGR
jgi:hypothetical protein